MTEWNIEVEHNFVGRYCVEAETLVEAEDIANDLFFESLYEIKHKNGLKETVYISEYVDEKTKNSE
jgi:hypothetical protein